jgi:hypothetical protein
MTGDSGGGPTDGGGGASDSGSGSTGDGGGHGITPPVSTCAAAKVSLGVETVAMISGASSPDVQNIVALDVNNDGAADLVGTDRSSFDVALSKKDGTFAAPTNILDPVGNGGGIVGGDFNGDGYQDVLVGSFGSGSVDDSVDLLLGKGDGTFHLPVNTPVLSSNIYTLIAADFNADGKLDFYFDGQDAKGIVLNSGGGTFAGPGTALSVTGLKAASFADINKDGAADLVYFDANAIAMCVGLNTGSGSFKPGVCYPTTTGQSGDFVRTGDINGDGNLDVVVVDENGDDGNNGAINVFLGKSDGTFNDRVPYEFATISTNALLVDANNDGKADLEVYEAYSGGQLSIFNGNADGTLGAPPAVMAFGAGSAQEHNPLVAGDFAGNGLRGFATTKDLDGNIDVITTTCKP